MRWPASKAAGIVALAAAAASGPTVARAEAPRLRLEGEATWQGFWYPKSPEPEQGTSVTWYANDTRGEYAAVREDDVAYAGGRNQVLFEPRLVGRWNDAGGVAEVQLRHDFSDPSRSRVLLKDLYADLRIGGLYASAGNQSIRWGRMDIFQPLDVLTPKDFDEPLFPEALAAPAIQVRASFASFNVQGVLLPGFVPSRFPAFAPARWDVLVPQPRAIHQPGGDYELTTVYKAIDEPALTEVDDPDPDDGVDPLEIQAGLRAELTLPGGDVAVSIYRGRDHLPSWFTYDILNAAGLDDFALVSQGEADVALTPWYAHVTTVGVDGDVVLGPVVLKAEAAYTITEDADRADCAADDPYLKWAAGGEFVRDELVAGMGLALRLEVTGDHELPVSDDGARNTDGLCLEQANFPDIVLYDPKHVNRFAFGGQIAWKFTPDLVFDVRGYASAERDWMLRPSLRYTFQEKVRIEAAALLVGGDEDGVQDGRPGYFWWYRDNDRVEATVSYLF